MDRSRHSSRAAIVRALSTISGFAVLATQPAAAWAGEGIAINEIRIDEPGADMNEYFELIGPPGAALAGLTYVVIGDGAGGSGVIELALRLDGSGLDAAGLFVQNVSSLGLSFENSDNVTHLLVEGFSGAVDDDLDVDDDGVLDLMPWAAVLDAVGLLEEPNPPSGTEFAYGTSLGFLDVGPDGPFVPGHVYRCASPSQPPGQQPWAIGPFDPADGFDTPGQPNVNCINDLCTDRLFIAREGLFEFDTTNAMTDGPPSELCLRFGNDQIDNDVWFCWTSPCSGQVVFETCRGTGVDTKIAVYDGCFPCDALPEPLACNDDACGLQSQVQFEAVGGQQYLLRIGTFPGAQGGFGTFTLACSQQGPTGACCVAGTCFVATEPDCVLQNGLYGGDGTECFDSDGDGLADPCDNCPVDANAGQEDTDGDGVGDPCDNCPLTGNPDQLDTNGNGIGDACETGACCFSDDTCFEPLTKGDCAGQGGVYQGDGSTCGMVVCGQTGACCLESSCVEPTTASRCVEIGGVFQGGGSTCDTSCLGACCMRDDCVENATQAQCDVLGGAFSPLSPCALVCIGGCCFDATCCSCCNVTPDTCAALGGDFAGISTCCYGLECVPTSPCHPVPPAIAGGVCIPLLKGACCLPDGSCSISSLDDCNVLGGSFQGTLTNCSFPDPCEGACCLADDSCIVDSAADCAGMGGTYQGDGTTCTPDPCAVGACCMSDDSCSGGGTEADCVSAGGTFQGPATTCTPDPCASTGGCCFADGSCMALSAFDCANAGGLLQGAGLDCTSTDCTFAETTLPGVLLKPVAVFAADLDGDGDRDPISASRNDDTIAYYENDGLTPNFSATVVFSLAFGAASVYAADLNGDRAVDMLAASRDDDTVRWFENDGGSPPFFTPRVITSTADFALSVHAADLDGDGDQDVLSASRDDDTVAWYENCGGNPPSFQEHALTTTADGPRSVVAADLDGDGRLDIVAGAETNDRVLWFRNDGGSPPGFVEQTPITTTADIVQTVAAADLDGDGDVDVMSASRGDNTIAWYENNGAATPAFTKRVLNAAANGASSVAAADLDGDGDLDVVSASFNDDTIAWYENQGGGPPITFSSAIVITNTADFVVQVHPVDLDGNCTPDLLAAVRDENAVVWYRNTIAPPVTCEGACCFADGTCSVTDQTACANAGGVFAGTGVDCTTDPCPIPCPADIDGNGTVDVDDLITVILNWNTNDPDADITNDGIVDVDDLIEVILNWGPCPVWSGAACS